MPTIRTSGGTSTDLLANLKFSVIPPGGAILNQWVSGATAADSFGLSVGNQDVIVPGTECNIEISADVVDIQRDQLVFDEIVPPGQMFMPTTATAEIQTVLHIRYL